MADEITFQQEHGNTWKARVSVTGVRLTRESIGAEGRPYTVETLVPWAEWNRLAAWVEFQRADQAAATLKA